MTSGRRPSCWPPRPRALRLLPPGRRPPRRPLRPRTPRFPSQGRRPPHRPPRPMTPQFSPRRRRPLRQPPKPRTRRSPSQGCLPPRRPRRPRTPRSPSQGAAPRAGRCAARARPKHSPPFLRPGLKHRAGLGLSFRVARQARAGLPSVTFWEAPPVGPGPSPGQDCGLGFAYGEGGAFG